MSGAFVDGVHLDVVVDTFVDWMSDYANLGKFRSVQEAYLAWLFEQGFRLLDDDFSKAVAVLLVYLSRSLVDPSYLSYLCNPMNTSQDQWKVLDVDCPSEEDPEERTFWEFMEESAYKTNYWRWQSSLPLG